MFRLVFEEHFNDFSYNFCILLLETSEPYVWSHLMYLFSQEYCCHSMAADVMANEWGTDPTLNVENIVWNSRLSSINYDICHSKQERFLRNKYILKAHAFRY